MKIEKKKLKESRKVQRTGEDQYQLSMKAKSIWEKLRKKSLSPDKKESLVNDLFMLLKSHIPNVSNLLIFTFFKFSGNLSVGKQ